MSADSLLFAKARLYSEFVATLEMFTFQFALLVYTSLSIVNYGLSRERTQQELVYLNRQVYNQTRQWRFNSGKTFNINSSRRKLRHLTATLTPAWIGQLQTTD